MQVPSVVGDRFQIERLAGSGGMGSVYRARDLGTGEPAAVKLLNPEPRHEWRFEREAELLAQLEHPYIVRYIAHGRLDDGRLYLALQWLEGEDLETRLAARGLTMKESLVLSRKVAEGLGAAHALGVVHRDVKPANIFLVDGDPTRPKLLDFGVARVMAASATRTGTTLGTPTYMSPEQATGQRVDPRSDVWSLGAVLFECLTGTPPFTGEHPMAILGKIVVARAPRVTELRPEVPPDVDGLVARLLTRDRDLRPPSGNAAAAELADLGEIGVPDRTTRSARRPTLTTTEQRLMGVIIADSWRGANVDIETAPTLTPLEVDSSLGNVRAVAAAFGGSLEVLAANSLMVTFTRGGGAAEQAARAARCALALRGATQDMRFAVSLGLGVLGENRAAGEVIDRAAALLHAASGLATSKAIVLDETTAGLLDTGFEIETVDTTRVLVSENEQLEVARTVLGRPIPCVGRDTELRMLRDVLEECVNDPGSRVVLVTGQAGMGKSRLVSELTRAARTSAVQPWVGRGDPMSEGTAHGLLSRMLRQTARIFDGEALEAQRAKLRKWVAGFVDPTQRATVEVFLGELCGIPFSAEGDVQLTAARHDPRLMGDQIQRAWEEFLRSACGKQPVFLLLEDLHWGDLASLNLALSAATTLSDLPLLVLMTGRPEVYESFPRLREVSDLVELRLRKLSRKAAEQLLREALGDGASEARIAEIVAQGDGNALYLEELARAAAEGSPDSAPETVLAMVQGRLESLDTELRRALRACSVFGDTFWLDGVKRLVGNTTHGAEWDIGKELASRELVTRQASTKFAGIEQYSFRHSLVREAAYRMLTEEDRQLGHRLAAEWLTEVGESSALVLAEHWDRGLAPEQSILCHRRAAELALAADDLERALSSVTRAEELGASGTVLGELELIRADIYEWQAQIEEAEVAARSAAGHLPAGSPGQLYAVAIAAICAARRGDSAELERAASSLSQGGPPGPRLAWGLARLTSHLLRLGHDEQVRGISARLDAARAQSPQDPLMALAHHGCQAWIALFAGDLAESLRHDEACADDAERAGNARLACKARAGAGYERMLLGDYQGAVDTLMAAKSVAERMGLVTVLLEVDHNLGYALARAGRLDEALDCEQRAVEGFARQRDWRMQGASHGYLAQIHLLRGDLDAAAVEAMMAAEMLSPTAATHSAGLACFARVRLAQDRPREALDLAQQAMEKLREAGSTEGNDPIVRLACIEALIKSGELTEARRLAREARDVIMVSANRIEDPDYRERFLKCVSENAQTLRLAAELLDDE